MTITESFTLVAGAGGVALLILGVVLVAGAILDSYFKRAEDDDA